MPINSLTNLSVPFPEQGNQALLMPKLQYRFRVLLVGFGTGSENVRELTRQVVDVTRPNLTFENIVLDVYNSKVNLAGKHTWEAVTLTLRDDANSVVMREVGTQIQRQFDFYDQSSASAASSYKFRTDIDILDGGNASGVNATVLERFSLVGCYIESANYNQLSYSANEHVTMTLSIRYDNAMQYSSDNASGRPYTTTTNRDPGNATG